MSISHNSNKKNKIQHVCQECGGITAKWMGQCPHCQSWNTLIEQIVEPEKNIVNHRAQKALMIDASSPVRPINQVELMDIPRIPTTIDELDRVLGGGLVLGAVILLGGDPGIGKSTLLLQTATTLAESGLKVIYCSGEESSGQIAMRAQRLGLNMSQDMATPLLLQTEIRLEAILATLEQERPFFAIIDSIQTIYSEQLSSAPGSVAQVRECAAQLTQFAKQNNVCLVMIGHVTKDGSLAGPRVLEHIVDSVLYFEGDSGTPFRMIRAFKNRFGAVNEMGVFAMTEKGLKEVTNPSALFLSHHSIAVSGSCIMVTQEGSRPLLVEVQALVDQAHIPNPRRLSVGLDNQRVSMLLAVLHRHAGIACFDHDVFMNIVGGVKITEPAGDLAVVLSIYSSLRNKPLPKDLVVFGEVGLAGEIRPAPRGQERLKEAVKLGFTQAIIPKLNAPKNNIKGMKIFPVERIEDAIQLVRDW